MDVDEVLALQMIAEDLAAYAGYEHADLAHICLVAAPNIPHDDPLERDLYQLAGRVRAVVGDVDQGLDWPRLVWAITAARILRTRYRADVGPEVEHEREVIVDMPDGVPGHGHEDDLVGRPPPRAPIATSITRHAPPERALTLPTREERAA